MPKLLPTLYEEATKHYNFLRQQRLHEDHELADIQTREVREWFKIRVAVASRLDAAEKQSAKKPGRTGLSDDPVDDFPTLEG